MRTLFTSGRALSVLAGLATAVAFAAGCGNSGSNNQGGDAGMTDATSSSSSGGSGSGSGSGSSSGSSGSEGGSSGGESVSADGGTVTLSTTGYDVSCQENSDCVLVETGSWSAADPCCGHGCPGVAINVADQSKYEAAATQAEIRCMPPGPSSCGVECVALTAYCNAGTCDTCMGTSCATAGDAAAE